MKLSRREFIRAATILGGTACLGGCTLFEAQGDVPLYIMGAAASDPVETILGIENVYSVCQMCEGNCGIRARIREGTVVKLDGNPYHPNSMEPHISYNVEPKSAIEYTGSLCVRGQAGIQTVYNPHRIQKPLKRVGPRGAHRWKTIPWDEAISEIVEGGDLFNEGKVAGLKEIRDTETPIERRSPEFGSKANQFVFLSGKVDLGSRAFISRFMNAYGSVNGKIEDTSVRQSSHRVGFRLSLDDRHDHLKPDYLNSRFLIFFGAAPLDSSAPLQTIARKLMKAKLGALGGSEAIQQKGYRKEFKNKYGSLKWVVIDPMLSQSASMADQWVPIKPCTDAALALAMMKWIIENKTYDSTFLRNTTRQAAEMDGEKSWTNATYLVRTDTMELLRAKDAGIEGPGDAFVVWLKGEPRAFDSVHHGHLEVQVQFNNIPCKSVFQLLKERVYEKSLSEYSEICGVESSVIEGLASEFSSHGKKAVADFYGGAVQHTNGTYTARTIIALNFLMGNIDAKGGLVVGGDSFEASERENVLGDLTTQPDGIKLSGVRIDRAGENYENSTEFRHRGYPAKRPWFPFVAPWGNFQEALPSIASGYPYPVKALLLYKANPAYSAPGMKASVRDTLQDAKKIPLVIAIDSDITETNTFADYILPDTTYLERWDICDVGPAIMSQTIGIRQPVIGNMDPKTHDYKPVIATTMLMEDILIRLAKATGLPAFGEDGFGTGQPLNNAWDFYKRAIAKITLPGRTEKERIEYVLSRGGRFSSYDAAYERNYPSRVYGGLCQIYNETLPKTKDSMTGRPYDGLPRYEPITDSMGKKLDDKTYPLHLISFRLPFHSRMRTAANRWLLEILPENYVLINPKDANELGIKTHDTIRIESPNLKGTVAKAAVREGISPGVVGIPNGFGRWALGATPVEIDGKEKAGDPRRGAGIPLTPLLRLDPVLQNVSLQDRIGANAAFNDTRIKIVKA